MMKCNTMKRRRRRNDFGVASNTTTTINKLWMWFLQTIAICILLVQCANALSCYRCGGLSPNVRRIQDCAGPYRIEECSSDEACVVFKRLYKRGSESVRGCYPKNQTLPGLSGSLIPPRARCSYLPRRRSPVKVCMCTTSLCNDNDYNVLTERPNQFLRKQLGPQRLPFNSVAEGEIENNYTNVYTGNNESTPGVLQSSKHNSTTTTPLLFLHPLSHKQKIPSNHHPSLPLSINNTQNNISIEPLYLDTSVKALDTQNVMLNNHELPVTPRDEAFLDKIEEEEEEFDDTIFDEIEFENYEDEDIQPNSSVSKHRVPRQAQGPNVICDTLNVLGATYANCDGRYKYTDDQVDWAPERPVFKHVAKDRYVFWNAGGLGWSIGKRAYLSSGSHWHRSGLDTAEPWQGRWAGGILVECVGNPEESGRGSSNANRQPQTSIANAGPIDCVWSGYGGWSRCSVTCGDGLQQRKRKILQQARNGGKRCDGDGIDTRSCSKQECPVDCEWDSFGAWTECSTSCGEGFQRRRRTIKQRESNGGRTCRGSETQSRNCDNGPCSVDCIWSDFGPWSKCSKTCGFGTQVRKRFFAVAATGPSGTPCLGAPTQQRSCNQKDCLTTTTRRPTTTTTRTPTTSTTVKSTTSGGDSCCDRLLVKATGGAKDDQSLYLGSYKKLSNSYNGRASYEREGTDKLYIYFFTSEADNLSLWVVGPELGKFIAGIRNDDDEQCVHNNREPWRYASRAGIWKEDDRTLAVKCYSPEDEIESTEFGAKRPDSRNPVSNRTPTTTTERSVNCRWGNYGSWSTCTATCGGRGTQNRVRSVVRQPSGGGRPCSGGNEQNRSCNNQRCPPTPTSTLRPTTRRPTTRRPATPRRNNQVKCFACGSLFSTDAPDCDVFDPASPDQRTTCGPGEACLWYSFVTAPGEPRSVIRECFSTGILLGSINDPVEPIPSCRPKNVEDDDSITACLCTEDYCNGYESDEEKAANRNRVTTQRPSRTTTRRPSRVQPTTRRQSFNQLTTTKRPKSQPRRPSPGDNSIATSDPNGPVLCHTCGSLFSGGNPNCKEFDARDSSQQDFCKQGEACLWYSWQKSDTETSVIRECFSPSILLGPINDPLTLDDTCTPKDISETPGSSIMACLCNTPLCNALNGGSGTGPVALPQVAPQRTTSSQRNKNPQRTQSSNNIEDELSREELAALAQFGSINTQQRPNDQSELPRTRAPQENKRNRFQSERQKPSSNRRPSPASSSVFDPQKEVLRPKLSGALQCFSCKSLLDPNKECDEFSNRDPNQVGTCGSNEACLLYAWKKSSTETSVLRECFPTSVLLGPIDNPLTAELECNLRDISEPGSSNIKACLCTTPFCNELADDPLINEVSSSNKKSSSSKSSAPSRRTTKRPRTTTRRPPRTTTRRSSFDDFRSKPAKSKKPKPVRLQSSSQRLSSTRTSCPRGFERLGNSSIGFGCYSFSRDRMGWIEAKKNCELNGAHLLTLESVEESEAVLEHLISQTRRRSRFEYWTAGNDIEKEDNWEWSGTRQPVPDFGWLDPPFPSAEENCLTWSITIVTSGRRRMSNGWHSDSCCNNVRFICEL